MQDIQSDHTLQISLTVFLPICNLAKVIDSFENKIPKEQLIVRWCMENMHPYSIDFIYSELIENFDINTIDAEMVEHDGIFEIDRFMSDLGKLYNAVRFYVALEGILFAEDDVAYNLYALNFISIQCFFYSFLISWLSILYLNQ